MYCRHTLRSFPEGPEDGLHSSSCLLPTGHQNQTAESRTTGSSRSCRFCCRFMNCERSRAKGPITTLAQPADTDRFTCRKRRSCAVRAPDERQLVVSNRRARGMSSADTNRCWLETSLSEAGAHHPGAAYLSTRCRKRHSPRTGVDYPSLLHCIHGVDNSYRNNQFY